jgi:UDP-N-acetylglucosamine--N-acetylmuramyl-(pentapeptide) pyrophosphoryl-undecaprenol N-acetylglucosamine transferase
LFTTEKFIITSTTPQSSIVAKLTNLVALLFSTLKILWIFMRNRPKSVISFGGYPTFPAALSAVILRIPLILHEQNSSLGQVNKLFLPFARKLYTSFPNTRNIGAKYLNAVTLTGLPLRSKIIALTRYAKTQAGAQSLRILVIGGSQGTKLFSDVIPNAIATLDPILQSKIQITQQVRGELINSTNAIYHKTNCQHKIEPFFRNIAELYQQHDLVIIRAGASSIAEVMSFQKAAIIIPFAKSKGNHQYYNAQFLEENSNIIMKEEKDFTIQWLCNCLKDFLAHPEKIQDIESSYNPKYSSMHLNAADAIKLI